MYDVYECKKNYAEMHVLVDTLIEIEQSSNPNSVFPDRKDASSAAHFNGFVVPPFLEPTQFSLPVDNSSSLLHIICIVDSRKSSGIHTTESRYANS